MDLVLGQSKMKNASMQGKVGMCMPKQGACLTSLHWLGTAYIGTGPVARVYSAWDIYSTLPNMYFRARATSSLERALVRQSAMLNAESTL
jgi:hypothetical protein